MNMKLLGLVGLLAFATTFTGCESDNALVDSRDGKSYKTVQIGDQLWMAENLSYSTRNSWCYDNKPANCEKYGRLYTWDAAQYACPQGFHLPSKDEFKTLHDYIFSKMNADRALMSKHGWKEENGTDEFGFSLLPAGTGDADNSTFIGIGEVAYLWSSTEKRKNSAYGVRSGGIDIHGAKKHLLYSVRCLQD